MWEKEYMDEVSVNPSKQKLLKSMWNNNVEGDWRYVLEKCKFMLLH